MSELLSFQIKYKIYLICFPFVKLDFGIHMITGISMIIESGGIKACDACYIGMLPMQSSQVTRGAYEGIVIILMC